MAAMRSTKIHKISKVFVPSNLIRLMLNGRNWRINRFWILKILIAACGDHSAWITSLRLKMKQKISKINSRIIEMSICAYRLQHLRLCVYLCGQNETTKFFSNDVSDAQGVWLLSDVCRRRWRHRRRWRRLTGKQASYSTMCVQRTYVCLWVWLRVYICLPVCERSLNIETNAVCHRKLLKHVCLSKTLDFEAISFGFCESVFFHFHVVHLLYLFGDFIVFESIRLLWCFDGMFN